MLPFGRKNARKCSECDITCHANCAHLVPDFCGMSMETASELVRNLRDINSRRKARPYPSETTSPQTLEARMGNLNMGAPQLPPAPPSKQPEVDQYGRPFSPGQYGGSDPYYQQQPPQQPLPPMQQQAQVPYPSPQMGRPGPPGRVQPTQVGAYPQQGDSHLPPRPPPGAYDPLNAGYNQQPYQQPPRLSQERPPQSPPQQQRRPPRVPVR